MRLTLDRFGSRGNFQFENRSLVDFQIRNQRNQEFRAAEIRFQLHKEFCAAEIRFSLHKEFSTVMDLEAMGAILMKIVILSKENWSHMDNFIYTKIFMGGDVDEMIDFERVK